METDELLNNTVSSELLAELLPDKTREQWRTWLNNSRNQNRKIPYKIPFVKIGGGAFYRREELAKFADFEKSRQLGSIKLTGRAAEVIQAFGIGTANGSSTGKRLDVGMATLQQDQATGTPFVQLIASNPLQVFRLEIDAALALGKDLTEVATAGKRIADRANSPKDAKREQEEFEALYETVSDKNGCKIQRLKK